MSDYLNNLLIEHFPEKIPENAENIVFRYNPGFLQAGTWLGLKFKTDSNLVEDYTKVLSKKAKWIGKADDSQAEEHRVFPETFENLGYTNLPEDFTIYVIYSEPGYPSNWNHGKLSLVAISKQRNEIIFLSNDW